MMTSSKLVNSLNSFPLKKCLQKLKTFEIKAKNRNGKVKIWLNKKEIRDLKKISHLFTKIT